MVESTALLADEDDRGVAATLINQATATQSRQTSLKETWFSSGWWSCVLWGCHHWRALVIPLGRVGISVLGVVHLQETEESSRGGKPDFK